MCQVITYAVHMTDGSGRLRAGGAAISQSKCDEHGWVFQPGEMVREGGLCPLGQIEKAKNEALSEIAEAKRGVRFSTFY